MVSPSDRFGMAILVGGALYRYLNLPDGTRAISFVHGFNEAAQGVDLRPSLIDRGDASSDR